MDTIQISESGDRLIISVPKAAIGDVILKEPFLKCNYVE